MSLVDNNTIRIPSNAEVKCMILRFVKVISEAHMHISPPMMLYNVYA